MNEYLYRHLSGMLDKMFLVWLEMSMRVDVGYLIAGVPQELRSCLKTYASLKWREMDQEILKAASHVGNVTAPNNMEHTILNLLSPYTIYVRFLLIGILGLVYLLIFSIDLYRFFKKSNANQRRGPKSERETIQIVCE